MRSNLVLVILGLLLLLAMVITLIYGREHGRHGYGQSGRPGALLLA